MMKLNVFLLFGVIFVFFLIFCESAPRSIPIRSDVIVTKWPQNSKGDHSLEDDDNENEPGWMRRQLMKFGKVASRVGNAMGAHTTKITLAIDKICEVVKTVIPLLAAVCHVGQFKFCSATTEAPGQLSEALNPSSLDLNIPD